MGVGVTPIAGLDSRVSGTIANIVPRHWPFGTTGICHGRRALCQLSFSARSRPYCRTAARIECVFGRHPRRALGARSSRSSVSLQGYIVIVEPDDLIRELLERWLRE